MTTDPIPNPEYERMVKANEGWDPFAHLENAYKRLTIGPRVSQLVCPGCKKVTAVRWNGPTPNGMYSTTCVECNYTRQE